MFLESSEVDLLSRDIDERHAADLRGRLSRFVEDWETPEMQIYDNYDASKCRLRIDDVGSGGDFDVRP